MSLELIIYLAIVLSAIFYAMLDGFDLGVGMLHPFIKGDMNKRIFINAIGPVWDGNEMWLVIVIGTLFSAFPDVYATLLSTFYLPVMVLLMGLIGRAVSIEFRSKRPSPRWRTVWDWVFSAGSLIIALGVGIFLGTLIEGIPLNKEQLLQGNLFDLITPFSLTVAFMTISLFIMHGSIFLVMKTEGALHDKIRSWVPRCISLFLFFFVATTTYTLVVYPYMIERITTYPLLFLIPLAVVVTILLVPHQMKKKRDGWAFLFSCLTIFLLLSLAAIGTFPNLIRSTIDTEINSLTLYNAVSSKLTLKILLIIIGTGVPLILGYGYYVYRVFRGKVKIESTSY